MFVPICQAGQHAHQKGLVHRDLKPANILVTSIDGKAAPKVIDFGVAKATAGKLTEESMATQFGVLDSPSDGNERPTATCLAAYGPIAPAPAQPAKLSRS